jgi:hypothetical protein
LQEGETTSSVLPRFERSCGRPTNRVLAKAANRTTNPLLCMQLGLPDLQLVAYRLGNFALRLNGGIRAIRADGRNYMFSVEWTPVESKEYVNVT